MGLYQAAAYPPEFGDFFLQLISFLLGDVFLIPCYPEMNEQEFQVCVHFPEVMDAVIRLECAIHHRVSDDSVARLFYLLAEAKLLRLREVSQKRINRVEEEFSFLLKHGRLHESSTSFLVTSQSLVHPRNTQIHSQ